jgi:hypothetical protein
MQRDDPAEIKGRWRRKALARWWDVDERTIDRMRAEGRLEQPAGYLGRIPFWTDKQRQRAERHTKKRVA